MYDDSSMVQQAMNPRYGDAKLFVEFRIHPMLNSIKSAEAGRPIYDDTEYVYIVSPGQRDEYFQPASEEDRQRFPQQYARFKAGEAEQTSGTPLALLPGLSKSQIEELAFFKIRTVEMLAEAPDALAGRLPGLYELKRKAQTLVAAATSNAPMAKVQAELEQRDAEINALKAQLAELAAAVAAKGKK